MDDTSRRTCFGTFNAEMDTTDFAERGLRISENYGTSAGFYGGFQCLENGRRAIIMTVWDVICEAGQGNRTVLKATPLYADSEARIKSESDVPPSRAISSSSSSTIPEWKKLVTWDLGYPSRYIKTEDLSGFLENYLVQYSGDVRSANFSNIRGRSAQSGEWVAADSVTFTVNSSMDVFEYIGSCQFGADDHSYYMITSGTGELNLPDRDKSTFSVKDPSDDMPY